MENEKQTIDYKAEYEKLIAEKNEQIRLESVGALKKALSSKAKIENPFDNPKILEKVNKLDVKTLNTFSDILNDIQIPMKMKTAPTGEGKSDPGNSNIKNPTSFQSYINR